MKNAVPEQTILQRIKPQCYSLHIKMRDQKDSLHETNQSVADSTGIPLSNVGKFFSGALANPSVFNTAAMCIHLGMSMDELFEIAPPDNAEKIKHLELQLERANSDLDLVKHHNELLESGIKDRKPVIFGLTAVCLLLTVALMSYLTMDVSNLNFGFFTHEGVSVIGIIIIALPLVSAVVLAARFIKGKKEKRTGINDKDRSDN